MRIGINILAYNAEDTIQNVLQRIPKQVYEQVQEITVFDDASQDGTAQAVMAAKQTLPFSEKIQVISHPSNLGYGGNQKFSYNHAIQKGLDVVVMLHGDGQYAPELLEKIYSPIVNGKADLIFGSRINGKPLKGKMPLHKFFGNIFLTRIQNFLVGSNFSEFHSGYRAFRVNCLAGIPLPKCTNLFHFDTQILILFFDRNFKIKEVTIPTFYGNEVSRVKIFSYGFKVLKEAVVYRLQKIYPKLKSVYSND